MEISMSKDSHVALAHSNSGRLDPIPGNPRDLQMMPVRARGRPPGSRLHSHDGSGMLNKPLTDNLQESPKRTHKCPHCIKAFPNTQQLSQHMLVHSGVRKYKCVFCDRAFKQLSHVQQHQRRHTGETPYKCRVEGCDRGFAQLANLQQHLRNHDNMKEAADRKPYQCNVCARRFTTQPSLKNHMGKMHELGPSGVNFNIDADKKFACQICGKRFVRERGLMKHIENTHSEKGMSAKMQLKVCTCPVCQKVFSRESYLLRHVQMKWDEGHRKELLKMEQSHIASLGGHDNLNSSTLKQELGSNDQAQPQQGSSDRDTASTSMDAHRRRTPEQPLSPQMDLSSHHHDENQAKNMRESSGDVIRRFIETSSSLPRNSALGANDPKDLTMQLESFRAYANQSTMLPAPTTVESVQMLHPGHLSPSSSYNKRTCGSDQSMEMHHRNLMSPYPRDHAEPLSSSDLSVQSSRANLMSPNPKQMAPVSTTRADFRDDGNRGGVHGAEGFHGHQAAVSQMAPLFRPESFSPNPLLNSNGEGSNKLASMAHIRATYRTGAENLQMNLNPSFNMWPRLGSQVCWPYQNQLPGPGIPSAAGVATSVTDHSREKYN